MEMKVLSLGDETLIILLKRSTAHPRGRVLYVQEDRFLLLGMILHGVIVINGTVICQDIHPIAPTLNTVGKESLTCRGKGSCAGGAVQNY